MDPAKWQEHLIILTRFPGRRFILACGLLHDRDLPRLRPPRRHLLLRLEVCEAALLPPTEMLSNCRRRIFRRIPSLIKTRHLKILTLLLHPQGMPQGIPPCFEVFSFSISLARCLR